MHHIWPREWKFVRSRSHFMSENCPIPEKVPGAQQAPSLW
jgi:hypothetical protein